MVDEKPKLNLFVGEEVDNLDEDYTYIKRTLFMGSPWPDKDFFAKAIKKSKESSDD